MKAKQGSWMPPATAMKAFMPILKESGIIADETKKAKAA
jgi:hypothetical protein